MVISGCATVALQMVPVHELSPGTCFMYRLYPHDSWVIGDEPYVSLHFSEPLSIRVRKFELED